MHATLGLETAILVGVFFLTVLVTLGATAPLRNPNSSTRVRIIAVLFTAILMLLPAGAWLALHSFGAM